MSEATQTGVIAMLLAPLPADVEQADTPQFRRQIGLDLKVVWSVGMERVLLAGADHTRAAIPLRAIPGNTLSSERRELEIANMRAFNAVLEAERLQCLIPAPTPKELRWKLRRLDSVTGKPEVAAIIAADKARLEGGAAL